MSECKKSAALSGEALRAATLEDAEQLTRKCEEGDFLRSQKIRGMWSPTREMLERHMLHQMDDFDKVTREIMLLKFAFAAQSLLILLLFILRR